MRPRAGFRMLPFVLLGLCLTAGVSIPPDHDHAHHPKKPTAGKQAEPSAPWYMYPFMKLIERHRKLGTKMDGPRCPMYPSCAAYAAKAVRRHSLLGFFLFIDRLFFRETGKLKTRYMTTPYRLSRHVRYYDPLRDTLPLFDVKRPSLYREDFAD